MTRLPLTRRWLFALGFALAITITPAFAAFAVSGLNHMVKATADAAGDCTTLHNGGSYSLYCGPNGAGGAWSPTNDWVGGLPSEQGLTQQNDQRGQGLESPRT